MNRSRGTVARPISLLPVVAAVIAVFAVAAAPASARPGDVVRDFNSGVATIPNSGYNLYHNGDVATDASGKPVLLAGEMTARFQLDGRRDTSFSTPDTPISDWRFDVSEAAGDSMYQAGVGGAHVGESPAGATPALILSAAKFTSAGPLDTSYSADGRATAAFKSLPIRGELIGDMLAGDWFELGDAIDMKVDGQGRAVVLYDLCARPHFVPGQAAGIACGYSGPLLVRFTAAGELDATFGTGGAAYATPLRETSRADRTVTSLLMQRDGSFLTVAVRPDLTTTEFAITRFATDGAPDQAFGTDASRTVTVPGAPSDRITVDATGEAVMQPNDRIVLIANASKGTLAGITPDAKLDGSFGRNGIASIPGVAYRPLLFTVDHDLANVLRLPALESVSYLSAISTDSAGRVTAVGMHSNIASSKRFGLFTARWLPDGRIDRSWGVRSHEISKTSGLGGLHVTDSLALAVAGDRAYAAVGDSVIAIRGGEARQDTTLPAPPRLLVTPQMTVRSYREGAPDLGYITTTYRTKYLRVGWTSVEKETGISHIQIWSRPGLRDLPYKTRSAFRLLMSETGPKLRPNKPATHCIKARAIDNAGNVGRWSQLVCRRF